MIIRIFIIPFVVKSKQELGTDELPSLSCKDSSVAPLPQCGGDQHGKLVVAQHQRNITQQCAGKLVVAQPDFGAR